MSVDRRTFLKGGVATLAGLSIAGCLGQDGDEGPGAGENGGQTDVGDEPVVPEEPGFFNVDGEILDEEMAPQCLDITSHQPFRNPSGFGVMGTVKNTCDRAATSVTVHARLLDENDEEVGVFETGLFDDTEQEPTDDLAAGEVWNFDILFEDTEPQLFGRENTNFELWATGEMADEGAGNGEENGAGNGTGNGTGNETEGNESA